MNRFESESETQDESDCYSQYYTEFFSPHSLPPDTLYKKANEEFLFPAPAVHQTFFNKLDSILGGFRPHEFTILCGATGVGKTTLLANLSRCLIEEKQAHFVASVETGPTDFMKRTISCFAAEDFNTGDAVELEKLKNFNAEYGRHFRNNPCLNLSLYDNRIDHYTLMAEIAWHRKNRDCQVAMIDNLNFFLEVTSESRQIIEMDRVVHDLIMFCKRVPVHVIMVMHPKKTEHGRVESEFDIKGSSTAVQEAQNVLLFNRAHPARVASKAVSFDDRELKFAKMRRRGRNVGSTLIFKSKNGVSYVEGDLF